MGYHGIYHQQYDFGELIHNVWPFDYCKNDEPLDGMGRPIKTMCYHNPMFFGPALAKTLPYALSIIPMINKIWKIYSIRRFTCSYHLDCTSYVIIPATPSNPSIAPNAIDEASSTRIDSLNPRFLVDFRHQARGEKWWLVSEFVTWEDDIPNMMGKS